MEVIKGDSIKKEEGSVVVALGTFDGIHYGHQQILNETINGAEEFGCESAMFSFTPHPLYIIAPKQAPYLLTNWKQRCRILNQLGIDKVYIKKFTPHFSKLSFKDFIKSYLVDGINARQVIVGQDFRFGHQGLGDVDKLKDLGQKFGFEVKVLEPVTINGQVVSSTYIRKLVKAGRIEEVKTYLTRNFSLIGRVVNGDKRGRQLGFPTANLKLVVDYVLPKSGVYAIYAYINGERLGGIVHLGPRPTFDREEFTIEAHLFDFTADIYQRKIEVEFVKRLRGEKNFASQKDLVGQIKKDIVEARDVLSED